MGYTFKQPASDFSKPQEEGSDFYRAVDTSTFCDITEANYYPNLLINRAFHKGGTYTNNKGKEVGYEFISLELIDDQRYIKANCTMRMIAREKLDVPNPTETMLDNMINDFLSEDAA